MSRHFTTETTAPTAQKDQELLPAGSPVSSTSTALDASRNGHPDFHSTKIVFESRDRAKNTAMMKARWGDGTRASTLVEPMLDTLARALARALAEAGAQAGGGTRTLTLVLAKAGTLTTPKALIAALTEVGVLALAKADRTTDPTIKPICLSGGGILVENGTAEPGIKLLYLPKETSSLRPPTGSEAMAWAGTLTWAGTLAGTGALPEAAAKELAAELAASYLVESLHSALNHGQTEDVAAGTLFTLVVAGIVDGPEIQPGIVAIKKIATSCESKPIWNRLDAENLVTQVIKNLDDNVLPNLFSNNAEAKAEMVKTKALANEAEGSAMEAMFAQGNTKRWYH